MKLYNPQPIDTQDIQLPRDLYGLMEELSRSNHDIWASQRISEGWTYGPNRDDKKKETPCLVDYNDLPENEKDYDRHTSGETLKSIYKLGFSITKRTEGQIMFIGEFNENDIIEFEKEANKHELKVVAFNDWISAKSVLERDLTRWHAIVLDTCAKLEKTEEPSNFFLRNVLDDLSGIFNRNRNEIPWFVMPNEFSEFTDALIKYTVGRERYKKGWGSVLYSKTNDLSGLMSSIAEVLPNTRNYRIRCVYSEVFEILEKHFPEKTKDILFNILLPLHFPEIYYSFVATDYYNNLRRILESFFKVCNQVGIIPSSICYKEDGTINLYFSCNYLVYGQSRRTPGDTQYKGICYGPIGNIIQNILELTNEGSHMGVEFKTKGLYFSIMAYSLQICDILLWLGKYIKDNDCQSIDDLIEYYEGKESLVCVDEQGHYFCEKCVLPQYYDTQNRLVGKKVVLFNVSENNSSSKRLYPLFAKFKFV